MLFDLHLVSLAFDILWPADLHIEVRYQTVGQRIDPAVDAKVLTASPSFLHKDVSLNVPDLPDNVQFTQTVEASAPIRDHVKGVPMVMVDLPDGGSQPFVG